MEIRQVRLEDIDGMKRMDDIFLKANHPIEYFKKNLDNTVVAVGDGEPIDYFMFKGQLAMNMLIHPDYRRRGIGKLLFRKATEKSKRFVSRAREDNVDAIEFLKRIGFKQKRKIEKYYKNGDNALEMEWKES